MNRADFLRNLRTERNLTLERLGVQSGTSSSTLRLIEADREGAKGVYRSTSVSILRALHSESPLNPDEIERFRDDFSLAARDVDQAIGDLQRAATATEGTEWAEAIRTDIGRIAAHIGAEPTAELIANIAACVSLASAQTQLDDELNLSRRLAGHKAKLDLEAAQPTRQRVVTVAQPPEAGPVPGSVSERFEHYSVDEATNELRRLVALKDQGKDIDAQDFADALASIARKTAAGE